MYMIKLFYSCSDIYSGGTFQITTFASTHIIFADRILMSIDLSTQISNLELRTGEAGYTCFNQGTH